MFILSEFALLFWQGVGYLLQSITHYSSKHFVPVLSKLKPLWFPRWYLSLSVYRVILPLPHSVQSVHLPFSRTDLPTKNLLILSSNIRPPHMNSSLLRQISSSIKLEPAGKRNNPKQETRLLGFLKLATLTTQLEVGNLC